MVLVRTAHGFELVYVSGKFMGFGGVGLSLFSLSLLSGGVGWVIGVVVI